MNNKSMTMEKLLSELQSVDTVKLVLTGCGESVYESREVYGAIRPFVEKQIAKKPTLEADGYDDSGNLIYDTWFCPNCETKYEVDYDDYGHCPYCGQKIDWSEE